MAEVSERVALDTSALVPALVPNHAMHELAGRSASSATHVLGIVAMETWSVLRRHAGLDANTTSALVQDHLDGRELVGTGAEQYLTVLGQGRALNLAGNVHDATILEVASVHEITVVTLDRGMARLAAGRVPTRLLTDELDDRP